jgi:hypothetical protein
MEAPPANAQKSATPFEDVVDLAIAIARAKGLDAANAEAAGRISLGLFFAETNGIKMWAMGVRTPTREVSKRDHPKIIVVEENGRR